MDVMLWLWPDWCEVRTTKPYGLFVTYGDFRSWACRKFELPGDQSAYRIFADQAGTSPGSAFGYPKMLRLDGGGTVAYDFYFNYLALVQDRLDTIGHTVVYAHGAAKEETELLALVADGHYNERIFVDHLGVYKQDVMRPAQGLHVWRVALQCMRLHCSEREAWLRAAFCCTGAIAPNPLAGVLLQIRTQLPALEHEQFIFRSELGEAVASFLNPCHPTSEAGVHLGTVACALMASCFPDTPRTLAWLQHAGDADAASAIEMLGFCRRPLFLDAINDAAWQDFAVWPDICDADLAGLRAFDTFDTVWHRPAVARALVHVMHTFRDCDSTSTPLPLRFDEAVFTGVVAGPLAHTAAVHLAAALHSSAHANVCRLAILLHALMKRCEQRYVPPAVLAHAHNVLAQACVKLLATEDDKDNDTGANACANSVTALGAVFDECCSGDSCCRGDGKPCVIFETLVSTHALDALLRMTDFLPAAGQLLEQLAQRALPWSVIETLATSATTCCPELPSDYAGPHCFRALHVWVLDMRAKAPKRYVGEPWWPVDANTGWGRLRLLQLLRSAALDHPWFSTLALAPAVVFAVVASCMYADVTTRGTAVGRELQDAVQQYIEVAQERARPGSPATKAAAALWAAYIARQRAVAAAPPPALFVLTRAHVGAAVQAYLAVNPLCFFRRVTELLRDGPRGTWVHLHGPAFAAHASADYHRRVSCFVATGGLSTLLEDLWDRCWPPTLGMLSFVVSSPYVSDAQAADVAIFLGRWLHRGVAREFVMTSVVVALSHAIVRSPAACAAVLYVCPRAAFAQWAEAAFPFVDVPQPQVVADALFALEKAKDSGAM